MVFSKRRLKSLDVSRHSVEKSFNTCSTKSVSSIVFESFYCIGSSYQNIKEYLCDLLVWLYPCRYMTLFQLWYDVVRHPTTWHRRWNDVVRLRGCSVFDAVLICFFEEFLTQFDVVWHVHILTGERKYPDINYIGR